MAQKETSQLMALQSSTYYQPIVTSTPVNLNRSQNILILGNIMTWVFLSVGILGLVSNTFVIFVIAKSRQLRQQPRNWFIFHQSVADFLSAICIATLLIKSANMKLDDVSFNSL